MGRVFIAALMFLFCPGACDHSARAADVLGDFRPSALQSAFGKVSQVEFSTELINLPPKMLMHSPEKAEKFFRFTEPVWIIAYRSEVYDGQGQPPQENYLCHTLVSDTIMDQGTDELDHRTLYSDSFTREVVLPDGFGFHFEAGESVLWTPLFNNRSDRPATVTMKSTVSVIRQKDLKQAMRRLHSTLRSVQHPHLFFVPVGRHERQTTFQFGFDGTLHFVGSHVHPYAESMDLFNISRQERVWKGSASTDAPNQTGGLGVYSSANGYPVRAKETYRATSVYNNPTEGEIDAMAGLFIMYSVD